MFTTRTAQASEARAYIYTYTVEPAITATLYNGYLFIVVTNEQSRPKFHNIEPVYNGHLLNVASGHLFVVPYIQSNLL